MAVFVEAEGRLAMSAPTSTDRVCLVLQRNHCAAVAAEGRDALQIAVSARVPS